MTVTAPWNPIHTGFGMTGTSTKPVPVLQLKILYNKYGTRNNRVKSLMWATRNRVHMLSPLMLLPLYYDIPVDGKRLQRTWQKRPSEVSSSPRSFPSSPRVFLSNTPEYFSSIRG